MECLTSRRGSRTARVSEAFPRGSRSSTPEAGGRGIALCHGPRQSSRVWLRCSWVGSWGSLALRTFGVKSERLLVQLDYLSQHPLLEAQPSPAQPSSLPSSLLPPPCPSSPVHSTLMRHHFFLVLKNITTVKHTETKNKAPKEQAIIQLLTANHVVKAWSCVLC